MLIAKTAQFFRKLKPFSVFSFSFSTDTAKVDQDAQQRKQQIPELDKRFSIRVLTEKNQEESVKLLDEVFSKNDPARHSFYKKFPERTNQEKLFWEALKNIYGKEIFTKGLSLGCFDLENREQLVAVTLSKDRNFSPLMNFESYDSSLRSVYDEIERQLYARAFPSYTQILTLKKAPIIEHWFGAVKAGYTGKRLINKLIVASDEAASKQNFDYSVCWATNFKTGRSMKRLNYTKISEMNVKEFIYKAVQYFEEVGQLDRYHSLWIRKLEKPQKKNEGKK